MAALGYTTSTEPIDVDPSTSQLWIRPAPLDADFVPIPFRVQAEELRFHSVVESGTAYVTGPHRSLVLDFRTLADGATRHCRVTRLAPPHLTVRGRVIGVVPHDGGIQVRGCGEVRRLVPGQRTFEISVPEGHPCVLTAWLQVGSLRRPGPDVEVVAWAGEETTATLELPDGGAAGFGFGFQVEDDGVVVTRVWPGTPAERAGLAVGDVIVEIDGVDTEGLATEDFLYVSLGEVDSIGEFVVVDDEGEEWALSAIRARIDVPEP